MYRTDIFNIKSIKIVHDWFWDFHFHCTILIFSEKIGYINEYLAKRGTDGISYEDAKNANYFRISTERIYLGLRFLDEFEFFMINKGYLVSSYRNNLSKRLIKEAIKLRNIEESNFALKLAINNYFKLISLSFSRIIFYFPRVVFKNKL